MYIGKILDKYDANFQVEKELAIVHGRNGSGKTLLLQKLVEYYRKQGENVLYFEDYRNFLLTEGDIEVALKEHEKHSRLRDFFKKDGEENNLFKKYDVSFEYLHLDREYGNNISSGYMQLVNFFCSILLCKEKTVVIIDEPERNLHIEFQRKLLKDLLSLKKVKKLIVATHSPSVLANYTSHAINIEDCVKMI